MAKYFVGMDVGNRYYTLLERMQTDSFLQGNLVIFNKIT